MENGHGLSGRGLQRRRALELLVVLAVVVTVGVAGVVPFLLERQHQARMIVVHSELRAAAAVLVGDDGRGVGEQDDGHMHGREARSLLVSLGYAPSSSIDPCSVEVARGVGCVSMRHHRAAQDWYITADHLVPRLGRCQDVILEDSLEALLGLTGRSNPAP